jgi:hypothetical protein
MRVLGKLRGIAIVFLVAQLVYAQDGWKSKPYRQWTKKDVIKLGSDSPWAQVRHADATVGDSLDPSGYMRAVTIQLRSALHIRQALVRVKQLEAKYDAMNDKQRAEFDAKTQEMLECPVCADKYIVALGPPVSTGPGANAINALRSATLGLLKGLVHISNERGERRELIHFNAPKFVGDEALFFFPRFDEKGRPLLTPENKTLIFFFDSHQGINTGYGPVTIPKRFEFNVSRLIVDGQVEF